MSNDLAVGYDLKTTVSVLYFAVSVSLKSDGSKYRKVEYCLYCKQGFSSRISKHYMAAHKDKEEVQKAVNEPVERQKLLYKLQQLGNYTHNCKVTFL